MYETVPAPDGVTQIDSTGAGDAYFGGILAYIYHFVRVCVRVDVCVRVRACSPTFPLLPPLLLTPVAQGQPQDVFDLRRMGQVASAAGAACCEVTGGLPQAGSFARMSELSPLAERLATLGKQERAELDAETTEELRSPAVGAVMANVAAYEVCACVGACFACARAPRGASHARRRACRLLWARAIGRTAWRSWADTSPSASEGRPPTPS